MKRTFLDKIIGAFSPEAELKRVKARYALERTYDAADTFRTDDWTSATKSSSNKEIKSAQASLRNKARDAVRNNPYANHCLNSIVANTVGAGIQPKIKAKTPEQTEKLKAAWKIWADTKLCDASGRNDYYGLQALALRSIAESGEILALKKTLSDAYKIQLLESDYLDSSKDDANTIQGVEIDKNGARTAYHIFSTHPGDGAAESTKVKAELIAHAFKADRPGQQRGVSWFHPVIRQLEDFNQFQQATLIRQKVAACFTAFVTSSPEESLLTAEEQQARRSLDSTLEPGVMRHLNPGEDIRFAAPPGIDGYAEYCRQTLRGVSAGLGLTYEIVSNDYSQVNFSSGRMGHLSMQRNIEMWRWGVVIPQFCEPTFKWFLEWACVINGISKEDQNAVTVDWVPPTREMIDPGSEIEAIKKQLRTGIKTLPQALKEQGYDPDEFFKEVQDTNTKLDAMGITFDSDPRKITGAGINQAEPATPTT